MVFATNSKSKFRVVAAFGVGMSTALVVPEIRAEIVEISWGGGLSFLQFTAQFGATQTSYSDPAQPADIDQVGTVNDFSVFYTQFTLGPYGSSMFSRRSFAIANKSIVAIGQVEPGDMISPDTFTGLGGFDIDGTGYAGFITNNGNVGWFKVQLQREVKPGVVSNGLFFSEGEFGTAAEALLVGGLVEIPVEFSDGVLTIGGTDEDDVIDVTNVGGVVTVVFNGLPQQFEGVQEINIDSLAGDDQITVNGFTGPISINGRSGDDTIEVNGPAIGVEIFGEEGNDTLIGGSGPDTIVGGAGNDEIDGRGGADFLVGGLAGGSPDVNRISGGNGADTIFGGLDVDIVDGGDGADTILTFGGEDVIMGGRGNDQIEAGSGNDIIAAGSGNDTVDAGTGDDEVTGSGGQDTIEGGPGNDVISGGAASDVIQGGSGNDSIQGNDGLDTINGGPDNDEIFGGKAADTISGGAGNDVLHGQSENDVINGNAGDDTLTGGGGQDQLNGGSGHDFATDSGELGETGIEKS